ncbi:MAG: hypothetical protein CMM73_05480 [Rhodospirillaceae bacterium]|nr:hypothetical protein [Rhodospirillaceae bacterium]
MAPVRYPIRLFLRHKGFSKLSYEFIIADFHPIFYQNSINEFDIEINEFNTDQNVEFGCSAPVAF